MSLFLIFSFSYPSSSTSSTPHARSAIAEDAMAASALLSSSPSATSIADFLAGFAGDDGRLLRLLDAIYHPRNLYFLLLDGAAPQDRRECLALAIRAIPTFRSARNVHVVGKPDFANPNRCSSLAAIIHGAAILLWVGANWDWFVNLDVSEYPLVTQDGGVFLGAFQLLEFLRTRTRFTGPKLGCGEGEVIYVDDIPSPKDCLYGAFVYSTHPLARIEGIKFNPTLASEKIITYISVNDIPPGGKNVGSGTIFGTEPLFADSLTECAGQPLGLVVKLGSQYYFYMETQTALAIPDEDNCIVVYSSTQCLETAQGLIAKCLGIPDHNVRVITRRVEEVLVGKLYG